MCWLADQAGVMHVQVMMFCFWRQSSMARYAPGFWKQLEGSMAPAQAPLALHQQTARTQLQEQTERLRAQAMLLLWHVPRTMQGGCILQ